MGIPWDSFAADLHVASWKCCDWIKALEVPGALGPVGLWVDPATSLEPFQKKNENMKHGIPCIKEVPLSKFLSDLQCRGFKRSVQNETSDCVLGSNYIHLVKLNHLKANKTLFTKFATRIFQIHGQTQTHGPNPRCHLIQGANKPTTTMGCGYKKHTDMCIHIVIPK